MRQIFLLLSFIVFPATIFSQANLSSLEQGKAWVKPIIIVGGAELKKIVSKKLLADGLLVKVDDRSYKVIAFSVGYDCHSGRLNSFDYNSKDYKSDHIPSNDHFLNGVFIGDLLDINNIWIEKDGKKYLLSSWAEFDVKE